MRKFHLERLEDESKVSGVGRVAEGVEFSDGSCTMRWLTAHRSTTVYASMADLVHIHGHGGKTQVVYEEGDSLVRIEKPHLALGFEGPDAEYESMTHNCGPSLPGARAAYDQVKEIWAPQGWTAMVCWEVGGVVYLEIRSPLRFLWTEEPSKARWAEGGSQNPVVHYEKHSAGFRISKEKGIETHIDYPTWEIKDEKMNVYVDGIRGKIRKSNFSMSGSAHEEKLPPRVSPPTIPPLSDLHSADLAPDRVSVPLVLQCECPYTDFKGGVCVKCGGRE